MNLIDKILNESVNPLGFLILEGINVNSLTQLFQHEFEETVVNVTYDSMSDEEKEKLKIYIEKRKNDIKTLVDEISSDPVYQAFIYKMLMKEDQKFPEDYDIVKDTIEAFGKIKNSGNFTGTKDIMGYESYQDLHKAVYEFKQEHGTKRNQQGEFSIGELVVETETFKVYYLEDKNFEEFSEFITDNDIAWCVKDKEYWAEYEPPYFYWEKEGKPFALLNYRSHQFLDIHNKEINQTDEIVEVMSKLNDDAYGLFEEYSFPIVMYKNPDASHEELFIELVDGEIDENGFISHDGSVDNNELIHFIKDGKLTIKFSEVVGDFDCSSIKLTSLVGCPKKVGRHFKCSYNHLTTLEGAPEEVGGYFKCNSNQLTSLVGSPIVGMSFDCAHNQLTNLIGSPRKVGKDFICSENILTSLEGAPEEVGRHFGASYMNNDISFTKEDVMAVTDVTGMIDVD